MSKEPREVIGHIDRHDVNKAVSISESDGNFKFAASGVAVGSLAFRTPSRDLGVTPEAVIAAVEDHLQSFDPSRGETDLAVASLESARHFLAAGRDFAKIVKRESSNEPVPVAKPEKPEVKQEAKEAKQEEKQVKNNPKNNKEK